jgi:hypothetical protein
MAAIRIFPQAIDNIAFLINNDADLNIKNYCDNLNLIQIVLLRIYGSTDYQKEISTEILNLILESSQLQSNPALKERLVNEPNPQGLPLCQTAAAKWTEGARLLIKHGADCTNGRYKDFLVPLIKEVEAERAKTTFDVLHGETLQEQKLPKPVANIVREYIEGEKTGAAQPAASKPSTTPATEVD